MATITIDIEDFLMALLNGDWFDCKHIPLVVGDKLRQYDPDEQYFHLDRHSPSAMFYDLYTLDGWKNEVRRREYLVTFIKNKTAVSPSKESLTKRLREAIMSNQVNDVMEIQKQIKKYYG